MGKKYSDCRGNTTDAYKLAAGEVTSTGKMSRGLKDLQQQVIEAVAVAKELKLTETLAELSHVTPDRIERIGKGKIPKNDNILAKIIIAWTEMKAQGIVPDKSSESCHEPKAFDEMFGYAHT